MLKLFVDNKDKLDDIIITEDTILNIRLDNCNREINIDVMDNMCLEVFELDNNTANEINYNLGINAQVIVNKLARNNSDITNINLNGEEASIKYYSNILNYKNNTYTFGVCHNASYTESDVVNHCVNFTKSEFKFMVTSSVVKKAIECYCNQDNKIIDMCGGRNYISPILLVDNDLIDANHSAYIGKFKKGIMFYLKSRGISEKECNALLIKGFLLQKMSLKELVLEEYSNFIKINLG